jgi:hypothetical protein
MKHMRRGFEHPAVSTITRLQMLKKATMKRVRHAVIGFGGKPRTVLCGVNKAGVIAGNKGLLNDEGTLFGKRGAERMRR